jgi:predicted nicotinamide N-methyase
MQDETSGPGFLEAETLDQLLERASKRFDVHFEPISIQDTELEILQIKDLEDYIDRLAESTGPGQTLQLPYWAKIWPTSILLSYYVQRLADAAPESELLEIGAGIGLCGLTAAARGMRVCITDSEPDALLFARINILKNGLQDRAEVAKADFTASRLSQRYTYIAGSEVLYREEHYEPLLAFLRDHLASEEQAEVVLARDYRIGAKAFFRAAKREFSIQEKTLGYRETSQSEGEGERHLCAITRLRPLKGA